YACGPSACRVACDTNDDCASGAVCAVEIHTCRGAALCVDDHTLRAPDGKETECAPYRCDGGACKMPCQSVHDCLEGAVCDQTGACAPPPAQDGETDDSSCAVRPASPEPEPGSGLLVVAIGSALARRARRGKPSRTGWGAGRALRSG